MDLRETIIKKLPLYYRENDTYKDVTGKGLLTRFLGMLGVELQEELVEPLENLINELDPETATNKFLSLLAFTVGNPTDLGGTDDDYRLRVIQALSLYKVAGTTRSYHLLFSLLGYSIWLEPLFLPDMRYDIGLRYDDDNGGSTDLTYDIDECNMACVEYNIHVYKAGTTEYAFVSDELKELILLAIRDIEPLDAILNELITAGSQPAGIFTPEFTPEFQ